MGIIKTWSEVNEAVGAAVGDGIVDAAVGIANGACNILSKYPNAFPLVPYARGFVKGVCSNVGQEIPEADVTFEGGQCPVRYIISVVYDLIPQGETASEERTTAAFASFSGPITAIDTDYSVNGGVIIVTAFSASSPQGSTSTINLPNGSSLVDGSVQPIVARVDGLEDNCGDSAPQLPPDAPVDPADFTPNITVNEYNEAGDVINTENYQVDFNNTDLSQFDFSLEVGGMTVNVDVGGINIGGGSPGEGQKPSQERKDIADNCGGGGVFSPEELVEEEGEETEEEVEAEASEVEYLLITVTELPDSGRTYVSDNPENIQFNAAYLRWTGFNEGQGYSFPDIPVRRLRTIHKRPDDAGGYVAYAVNGAKIRISKFVIEEGEE